MKNLNEKNKYPLKNILFMVLIIYLPILLLFAILSHIIKNTKYSWGYLFRDPVHITHESAFMGIFSNFGILISCACASICFFTFALLYSVNKDNKKHFFFLYAGIMTLILLLDDLLLMHEIFYPKFLNIPEYITFGAYAFMLGFFLFTFREQIFKSEYIILILAGALITFSFFMDFWNSNKTGSLLLEDGSKFLAIVTYFIYFAKTCFKAIKTNLLQDIN